MAKLPFFVWIVTIFYRSYSICDNKSEYHENGLTIIVQLAAMDTVKVIKVEISKKTGISLQEQRLIYLGIELKDERTLSDYNLQNNSTIQLYTSKFIIVVCQVASFYKRCMLACIWPCNFQKKKFEVGIK